MTRADNIRSLSDEELALRIARIMLKLQALILQKHKFLKNDEVWLQKLVLESLQKPVEED